MRRVVMIMSMSFLLACSPSQSAPPVPDAPCVFNLAYADNVAPDTSVDVQSATDCYVLVDLDENISSQDVAVLQRAGNQVGCYLSVGTAERWRSDIEDLRQFASNEDWDDWPGEFFIDDVDGASPIMQERITRMADAGCDWVEFDNMDWALDGEAQLNYGVRVTKRDAEQYVTDLCKATRDLGMSCMAKNVVLGRGLFAGGTFESYPDELDWWISTHLSGIASSGGLAVIVHYGNGDCDKTLSYYRAAYGPTIGFICESAAMHQYRHFNGG